MILTPLNNFKGFDLDNHLLDIRAQRTSPDLLVILPTNRKQREFKKYLATNFQGKLTLPTETIRSLALKIAKKIEPHFQIIPEEILDIYLAEIVAGMKDNDLVKNFTRGSVELIKNTISEFKENGTNLNSLILDLKELNPVNVEKALLLARIWTELDIKLKESKMKEMGDVYLLLQANKWRIPEAFKSLFPAVQQVFMQNFIELVSPEIDLVEGIATAVSNKIYIEFDYSKYNSNLFEKIENCFSRLETAGFREYTDPREDRSPQFFAFVRENLFKSGKKQKTDLKNIFEFEGSTLHDEVTLVAKTIKKLLLEDKQSLPSDVCVLFHRVGNYTPWVRSIFNSYGIPVNITDRYKAGDFSSVSGIIDLLSIINANFNLKSVFRALSYPVLQKRYGSAGNFKKACALTGVTSRYDRMYKYMTEQLQSYNPVEPLDDDEDDIDETNPATILASALKTLETLKNDLDDLTKTQEPAEFYHSFEKLMRNINYLAEFIAQSDNSGLYNIRALTQFLNAAGYLFNVLQLHDNKSRTFEEYFEIMTNLSQETRFNLIEQPETGVMITSPNEVRGLKFKHVFICALNDGDFPTRYRPGIFKYDGASEQIRKHSAEERILFYQALSSWKGKEDGKLFLTGSKRTSGKENVESFFKREMKDIFTVSQVDVSTMPDYLYSWSDLNAAFESIPREKKLEVFPATENSYQPGFHEIEKRRQIYRSQNNIDGDGAKNAWSGFITFDENDETPVSIPILHRVNEEFSATSLESYAACPYQFFVRHILKASPAEEISEELEAREFGTLLHEILKTFHLNLKNEGKSLANCSDEDLKEFLDQIISIALDNSIVDLPGLMDTESFLAAEKILGIAGNNVFSILYKYLDEARKEPADLLPSLFENKFSGLKIKGLNSETRKIPYEIKIRGIIDRIDINEEDECYKIIDYKSGGSDYPEPEIRNGHKLQIPIYLMATVKNKVTDLPKHHLYLHPAIFSLKYHEKEFGKKDLTYPKGGVDNHETAKSKWDDLLTVSEEFIQKYVLSMLHGEFPLSKDISAKKPPCTWCNLDALCRVKDYNG